MIGLQRVAVDKLLADRHCNVTVTHVLCNVSLVQQSALLQIFPATANH